MFGEFIATMGCLNKKLGGGNSNMFYVHPENCGDDPIWWASIFQVETLKPPTSSNGIIKITI